MPSPSSRSATRTTVAGAAGSTTRTPPKPGLLAWWSTTTELAAPSSRGPSPPSRPGEAASRLTNRSGDAGTAEEGTSPSAPGSQASDAGSVNGAGNVASTRAPRRRRPSARASVLPRASASGCTCPERTTVARAAAASASTAAARPVRSVPRGREMVTSPGRGRRPGTRSPPRSPARRRPGTPRRRSARRTRCSAPRRSRPACRRGWGRPRRARGGRPAPSGPAPRRAGSGRGRSRSSEAPAPGGHVAAVIGSPAVGTLLGGVVLVVVLGGTAVGVGVPGVRGAGADAGELGVGVPHPLERLVELTRGVGHVVGDEGERGHELDARLPADCRAQHAGGRREGPGGVLDLRRVAVDGVEDRRLTQVAGHPGVGDGHHAEPRVLDLRLDRGGDDLADAPREVAGAGRVGHRTSWCWAPRCAGAGWYEAAGTRPRAAPSRV